MIDTPYVPKVYRVLVVDDDELWADRCIHALKDKGIDVDYVTGADEAITMFAKRHYHGAILDKNMRDLTGHYSKRAGIDLLEYIREKHADTSQLIMTSDPTIQTYQEAERLGLFDYRDKDDVSPREVAEIVVRMFEARLVTVFTRSGMPTQTDRMYFFDKPGTVTKTVTISVGEQAGCIIIDGEEWYATTKAMPMAITIPTDTPIRAHGIYEGAIQVSSEVY